MMISAIYNSISTTGSYEASFSMSSIAAYVEFWTSTDYDTHWPKDLHLYNIDSPYHKINPINYQWTVSYLVVVQRK